MKERVNLYFYAGDFVDAIRRYREGETQIYATHNEVARLLLDLAAAKYDVNVFSFVTPTKEVECPAEGLKIHQLGAMKYNDPHVVEAFNNSKAQHSVLHFPHPGLLRAGAQSEGRSFPICANSYNRRGVRPALERWKIARLLNSPKFRFVSNHCRPATEHLASFGVERAKLIPWNVPVSQSPRVLPVKKCRTRGELTVAFAGSVTEDKGVGDLLKAVALLKKDYPHLRCLIAGRGDVDRFQAEASKLGVADATEFLGLVSNTQVQKLFRDADVIVVPSRRIYTEGFPLVLIEAIASRTPIVCSDHPMFVPVMKDRDTAMVYSEGRPSELATSVRTLMSEPAMYEKISRNAEKAWDDLQRTADWRTMIFDWVSQGDQAPYLLANTLDA